MSKRSQEKNGHNRGIPKSTPLHTASLLESLQMALNNYEFSQANNLSTKWIQAYPIQPIKTLETVFSFQRQAALEKKQRSFTQALFNHSAAALFYLDRNDFMRLLLSLLQIVDITAYLGRRIFADILLDALFRSIQLPSKKAEKMSLADILGMVCLWRVAVPISIGDFQEAKHTFRHVLRSLPASIKPNVRKSDAYFIGRLWVKAIDSNDQIYLNDIGDTPVNNPTTTIITLQDRLKTWEKVYLIINEAGQLLHLL